METAAATLPALPVKTCLRLTINRNLDHLRSEQGSHGASSDRSHGVPYVGGGFSTGGGCDTDSAIVRVGGFHACRIASSA